MPIRSAFYIDGFNVYHAIDDLGRPHYKWLDWMALSNRLIPSSTERVVKVSMCTAIKPKDPGKQIRHRAYIKALNSVGVKCITGHFSVEPRECKSCGTTWIAPVEKQGDVNLALELMCDAHEDVFDHCYLVSADSDQAATARFLKEKFPTKSLTSVIVTGRSHSKEILGRADAKITVTASSIEACLFPKLIPGPSAILRPKEYDPPGGP
ncbi:MAG: NYN domain-containing protein [Maricaulaceae bacterium]|nr:NYN domain-containing protein [Maricaulaceae bacterium]